MPDHEENKTTGFNDTEIDDMHKAMNATHSYLTGEIVATQVDKFLYNNKGYDVVLHICSETKHCQEYNTRYNRVLERLDSNKNIKLYRINYLLNEIPGVKFTKVPALIIVPDIEKNTDKTVHYFTESKYTTANLIAFIQKHVVRPLDVKTIAVDNKHKKQEDSIKTKFVDRLTDEVAADEESGHTVGNGFTRSLQRYWHEYETSKNEMVEDKQYEDHDSEEYDEDDEKKSLKDEF